jgi:hypothetical protein
MEHLSHCSISRARLLRFNRGMLCLIPRLSFSAVQWHCVSGIRSIIPHPQEDNARAPQNG